MRTKQKIYNLLVNKVPGITYRYHKMHDGTMGKKRIFQWIYLLLLNFAYYVLFFRFLGKRPDVEYYETKRLPVKVSESQEFKETNPQLNVSVYVDKLSKYDIISFDIFDTLIFRPLSLPTDVFYMIGEQMDICDFKNIRVWAEMNAREKCNNKNGHTEINLEDIWKNIEEDTGLSAKKGMEIEQQIENALCYANPFMLEVWDSLIKMGKKIVIVSDMYLPEKCIADILEKAGFVGAEKIYISQKYGKSKANGRLYHEVIKDLFGIDTDKGMKLGHDISRKNVNINLNANGISMVHVGDNPHSDADMAQKNGIDVFPYKNVNHNTILYRPFDMSYMVGSAYRGLVSNHLYNGLGSFSMEYEYGYLYGGLFVLGYCSFIHDYCQKNKVDILLFLSRDGDILWQVYEYMYPEEKTEYVYWSRKAATKLMADEDKHDFFRRFIYHKINQDYSIRDVLHSMELDFLEETLNEQTESEFIDIKAEDKLTEKNAYLLRRFIENKWDKVIAAYELQQRAAKNYYGEILNGCHKAVAVDIGWAGSGALALSHLVSKVWGIPCEIVGLIAGTNTIHNAEPDASEPFLQSGRLVSYLYSQGHNRDLLKKHDPNKNYNVYWELLLSSPTPQFAGFYDEDGKVTLRFGRYDANQEGIKEVQQGILDFAHQYCEHFKDFQYMFNISGRDAYAPMLVAASYNEKYLKTIEKKFALEINVN